MYEYEYDYVLGQHIVQPFSSLRYSSDDKDQPARGRYGAEIKLRIPSCEAHWRW